MNFSFKACVATLSDRITWKIFKNMQALQLQKAKRQYFQEFLLICTTSSAACQTIRLRSTAKTTWKKNHMHTIASLGGFIKDCHYVTHTFIAVSFSDFEWQPFNNMLVSLMVSCLLLLNHVTGGQGIRQHEETQSREGMLPRTSPPLWHHHKTGRPCYICKLCPD